MKNRIYITNEQSEVKCTLAMKNLIKKAVNTSLKFEDFQRPCEVSVTLTDNAGIHQLNREHRGVDRPTDVLSFPIFDDEFDDGELCILGDIVISLEKALSQAEEYGHTFERELAFLTVHSMLHLLGYDHEEGLAMESEMFEKQEIILSSMGLTRKI